MAGSNGEDNTGKVSPEGAQPPTQGAAPLQPSPAPQPTPAPEKKTEKVNVDDMQEEDKGMLEVDWGGDKNDELFKGKTRSIPDAPKSNPSSGPSPTSTPQSTEKFKFGISVVVAIIDFIISTILSKIAGEGEKASSYKASAPEKETFEEALCMMLETKKDLMPTWLIVLLAFASAWGFQIMAAIQARQQKGKPVTERKENAADAIKEGLFIGTDGKVYRRYKNGSVHRAKFDTNGVEIKIGQPPRRHAA